MMKVIISPKNFSREFEIVERKGAGHPDTLADGLAETLSTEYALFTLKKFGAVLHHNFDKVRILGGSSYVSFGKGFLTSPLRVLINGRVSTKFAEERTPTHRLLTQWTKAFLKEKLPLIDPDEDLEIHLNLSSQSSPGKTYEKEAKKAHVNDGLNLKGYKTCPNWEDCRSNDTSLGVGYAPASQLEKVVLRIERE